MPSRRRYLAILGSGIAGCAGGRDTPSPTGTPTETDTATGTRTDTPTDTLTESPHPPTETPMQTAAPPASVDGAWRHPLHDAGHTGFTPGGTGPTEKPGKFWEAYYPDTPGTPVIADETLFVGVGDRAVALDAITGSERWSRSFDAAENRVGPLTVAGDALVFGVGSDVVAVAAADGSTRWRTTVGGAASPVVGDSAVYDAGSSTLVSLSLAAGKERWRRKFDVDGSLNRPAPVGDAVYLSDSASAGKVRAIDAGDGTVRWAEHAGSHPTAVTVRDDRVYAGGFYGNVTALAADDGSAIWSANAGPAIGRILTGPRNLYAAGDGADVAVACKDAWSGSTNWTADTGYPIAATGETVFVADADRLRALGAQQGEERWTVPIGAGRAAVVDDLLYVATDAGIVALR